MDRLKTQASKLLKQQNLSLLIRDTEWCDIPMTCIPGLRNTLFPDEPFELYAAKGPDDKKKNNIVYMYRQTF